MRLPARVAKLEQDAGPIKLDRDLSVLSSDELRLVASLPMLADGTADLSGLPAEALDDLERVMTKLETGTSSAA